MWLYRFHIGGKQGSQPDERLLEMAQLPSCGIRSAEHALLCNKDDSFGGRKVGLREYLQKNLWL